MGSEAVPLQVAVEAYIESHVSMSRHWRKFSPDQRKLADAIDLELVRLIRTVGADDYFGALGIAPTEDLVMIRFAADNISERFSEARVRAHGLNRKSGGWVSKARQIDALARNARDTLGQMKREGKLDAFVAQCHSALVMEMARPAAAPAIIEHHQDELGPR